MPRRQHRSQTATAEVGSRSISVPTVDRRPRHIGLGSRRQRGRLKIAIEFAGATGEISNYLPIMDGWNNQPLSLLQSRLHFSGRLLKPHVAIVHLSRKRIATTFFINFPASNRIRELYKPSAAGSIVDYRTRLRLPHGEAVGSRLLNILPPFCGALQCAALEVSRPGSAAIGLGNRDTSNAFPSINVETQP